MVNTHKAHENLRILLPKLFRRKYALNISQCKSKKEIQFQLQTLTSIK